MPEFAPTAIDGPLDEAQIASFSQHGFVHVAGLIDGQQLAELRSWVDDIQGWPETSPAWTHESRLSELERGVRLPTTGQINNLEKYYEVASGGLVDLDQLN